MLSNKNNNLATFSLQRRAAWFALLPIALLQLTVAVHQFDHVAESVDDSCYVCVQLDRLDAAVDQPAEPAPLASLDSLRADSLSISERRNDFRNFDSRAPPRI